MTSNRTLQAGVISAMMSVPKALVMSLAGHLQPLKVRLSAFPLLLP